MDDNAKFIEDKLSTEITINGVTLNILAWRVEKEQWQLSVENKYGVRTNWLELFPTAQLAINAGIKAIENEGIETFVDTEGFEYLYEENV